MVNVSEIFYSFQGEGKYAGTPCLFLRLSGCNFKCSFCDTNHDTEKVYSVEYLTSVLNHFLQEYNCDLLVITGGEPLLQYKSICQLIGGLHCKVQIETNGSIIEPILKNVDYVVSPKNNERLLFDFYHAYDNVYFKFLIKNQDDINLVKSLQKEYDYQKTLWLQPLWQKDKEVTQLILNNKLRNIKISGQLHKYLNQR